MKCSKKDICLTPCDGSIPKQYAELIFSGVQKGLENSKVPATLTNKISLLIDEELDACDFCDKSRSHLENSMKPKGRILDRAIVHMFELFYGMIIERSRLRNKLKKSAPEFFNIVPRGDCLDLFLKIVKEHCIGGEGIEANTSQLELLLKDYSQAGIVDWASVYSCPDFMNYLDSLLESIFNQMTNEQYPIPALNNGMKSKHNPEQINLMLRHMLKIWQENEQAISGVMVEIEQVS